MGPPAEFYKLIASDPFQFAHAFWPDVKFYDKQKEVILSVEQNGETVVPAGNMLGVRPPAYI